ASASRPYVAEAFREVLRLLVAWPGEGIDLAALMARHLRHDVRRGAKAVDGEPRRLPRNRLARHLERTIADQPCAEQRGGFRVAIAFRNRKDIARVGNRVLGIAAVDLVAGETRIVAKILAARPAIEARAVGEAEPWHADALTELEALHL